MKNKGARRLFCALLDLTQTFGVFSATMGGGVWLDPGRETWANDGRAYAAELPDRIWRDGLLEITDVFKLLVATEEFDVTLLGQADLEVAVERARSAARAGEPSGRAVWQDRDVEHKPIRSALERLMRRVHTRHLSSASTEAPVDWAALEYLFVTVRPQESVPVPASGERDLGFGVVLGGHSGLTGARARARLTTAPEASRAVGGRPLPPLLNDNPTVVRPLELATTRGDAGLSVLELQDVADHTVVTPEAPLHLRVATVLAAGEHVLPVGYDPEDGLFLPLGWSRTRKDEVDITLERLPAPEYYDDEDARARGLFKSIRIFLHKVISKPLGLEYSYPILAAADVNDYGEVTYVPEREKVAQRVENARRIVLYVHGIIGDTRGMAASARYLAHAPAEPLPFLADRYDLLLTFDYENLHTTIEETARALKDQLAGVGLGVAHDKTLDVVAHSMGGLVSRWFIEREQGHLVVNRLVMLGTPNGGSPWSTLQDWASAALGLGLNVLGAVPWPAQALGWLLGAVEKIDNTLDQMKPGSNLLENLSAGRQAVPSSLVVGNTSLHVTLKASDAKERRTRLLKRLVHHAAALAFFDAPNDIAVSVESMQHLPEGRVPAPEVREVYCDHLTYFTTEDGLRTVAEALGHPAPAPQV